MSLRAGANHPTHLPFIKRPPKPLLLGYQGGDADDETTRRRGALDITTHFIRVAFRRVVPVQRQRVNTLPRAGACSGDRLNTLPGVHRITPSSGIFSVFPKSLRAQRAGRVAPRRGGAKRRAAALGAAQRRKAPPQAAERRAAHKACFSAFNFAPIIEKQKMLTGRSSGIRPVL